MYYFNGFQLGIERFTLSDFFLLPLQTLCSGVILRSKWYVKKAKGLYMRRVNSFY